MRIKEICDFVSRGTTPEYVDDSPFKVMNQATFSKGWLDESNIRFTSKPAYDARITQGDLLMASTGGGVLGKVFYFDKDDTCFYADSHVSILRNSKGKHLMKFLYYYFLIRYEEINATMVKGSTNQTELQRNYLLAYEINMPTLSVQQKIVDYLNEKTSAIDAQVELLEKKKDAYTRLKKAMINRAVTHGLDEHVKLKDSGVEWIGMIPEHWEVKRFKDVYNKSNVGESIDKEYCTDNETDYLFYTAGIIPIHTDFEEFPQWKYTNRNDLLLARNGTPYVYLPKCNSVYSDHIIRVDIKKSFCREYVRFCLQQAISTEIVDSVSITTWSISIWNKQLMPFPPFSEQQSIAAYLDEKSAKIDAAIANIDKQTDALKRLKRSLINEVITGQRAV